MADREGVVVKIRYGPSYKCFSSKKSQKTDNNAQNIGKKKHFSTSPIS